MLSHQSNADNPDYLKFRELYNDPKNGELLRKVDTESLMSTFGKLASRRHFGYLLRVLYDNEIRDGKKHQQAIVPEWTLVKANLRYFFEKIADNGAIPNREARKAFAHIGTETISGRLESSIRRGHLAGITEELYRVYLLNKKSPFLNKWKSAEH